MNEKLRKSGLYSFPSTQVAIKYSSKLNVAFKNIGTSLDRAC